jgi:hypothetical protein
MPINIIRGTKVGRHGLILLRIRSISPLRARRLQRKNMAQKLLGELWSPAGVPPILRINPDTYCAVPCDLLK